MVEVETLVIMSECICASYGVRADCLVCMCVTVLKIVWNWHELAPSL